MPAAAAKNGRLKPLGEDRKSGGCKAALMAFCIAGTIGFSSLRAAEPAPAPTAKEFLDRAKKSYESGKVEEALGLTTQAINVDPQSESGYYYRARIYENKGDHARAIADFDQVIKINLRASHVYQLRGAEQFKAGHILESIADFDRYLALEPDQEAYHWQRGISYYYAGKFEEGRKQFELHQTVNPHDVENAVWHFLCNAKANGLEKARAALIKIQGDSRVPLMQVQALFAGNAKPEDVLAAAKAGNPSESQLQERMFYANLYLGLYYEAVGDDALSREHIKAAVKDFRPGNYMWEVARVHQMLRAKTEKKPVAAPVKN